MRKILYAIPLILLIALFFIGSCEKDELVGPFKTELRTKPPKPDMTPESAEKILRGTWAWVRTTYEVRGQKDRIETPESLGYAKTAVFKAGKTADILIDLVKEVTYTYEISSDKEGNLFIDFSSQEDEKQYMEDGPLVLEQGKFVIRGGYDDSGGTIEFARL